MAQFVIVYLGGNPPATPEEGKQHMAAYQKWLGGLGDAVVSPANPFKDTHVVSADGEVTKGSSVAMSGYTIIEAESIEAAVEITKQCPFLGIGGTLEVSEKINMPG